MGRVAISQSMRSISISLVNLSLRHLISSIFLIIFPPKEIDCKLDKVGSFLSSSALKWLSISSIFLKNFYIK